MAKKEEVAEISGRKFIKKYQNSKKDPNIIEWFFDRTESLNRADIAYSASLAFHKSLIGICELDEMETAEKLSEVELRSSKAVQTYYVLYHLFTGCMLLDSEYEIIFSARRTDDNPKGFPKYGQEKNRVRLRPKMSQHWKNRGRVEQDLATRIKHQDIKNYCNAMRKSVKEVGSFSGFHSLLYEAFVREDCSVFLFEKADYIRDRVIYRPSCVPYSDATENDVVEYSQTSKDLRTQINSMPSSEMLYDIVRKMILYICADSTIPKAEFPSCFLNVIIDCNTKYAKQLGYLWDDLSAIGGDKSGNSVPAFVGQMMELYNPKKTKKYYEKYWKSLFDDVKRVTFNTSIK